MIFQLQMRGNLEVFWCAVVITLGLRLRTCELSLQTTVVYLEYQEFSDCMAPNKPLKYMKEEMQITNWK